MDIVGRVMISIKRVFQHRVDPNPTQEIDAIRQNSPPDERDVDLVEQIARREVNEHFPRERNASKKLMSRAKKAGRQ